MSSSFYRAFEDRHRGTRDTIKARLAVYLPFVRPLSEIYPDARAIDLGCGRGEWLELLGDTGIAGRGVDLDENMLAEGRALNLAVETGDALAALKALPDESQAVVSAFHLAEHMPFDDVHALVREALRVLRPAGLLILETPNPENVVVGTSGFYLDPTHQRPLPPGLLAFMPEHYGFHRTKILRLQEPAWLTAETPLSLVSVLRDVSPDYAVVAQKDGPGDQLARFDAAFAPEYGLTLEGLATRYDAQSEARAQRAEAAGHEAQERAHRAETLAREAQASASSAWANAQGCQAAVQEALAQARQAQSHAEHAQAQVAQIIASGSWRITAPLRAAAAAIKRILGR